MYFKLATRNLKKSLKDYTIYFLTLVLGVCIFKEEVSLGENEYLAFGDIDYLRKSIQESINNNTKIKININGKDLSPADMKVFNIISYDSTMKNNIYTFVVNDNLVNGLTPINTYLNVNYKGDKESSEEKVTEMIEANNGGDNSSLYYISKLGVESTKAGVGAMISYLAIYMGFIFLITSAAY